MSDIREWFKVVKDGKLIGAVTEQSFARYSETSGRIHICEAIEGQYVIVNDLYYHDDWMLPINPKSYMDYEPATVVSISEKEYDMINEGTIEEPVNTIIEPEKEDIPKRTLSESEEATVEFIRKKKLKELSSECEKAIENGFSLVLGDGASHHFSLTMEDQINLFAMEMAIELGKEPIYHADGELTQYYGEEDARAIIAGAKQWRLYNTTRYNSLKNWVENIDDLEEIDAVKYDSDIPEEYCTDVLKDLTDNF